MSTRTNIIIKDSGKNIQKVIYHHCDGYFEGVGKELLTIISQYVKKYNKFTINDFFVDIVSFDYQYEEDTSIHTDIEYLYMIDIISSTLIVFKCWDVPCFGEYDYTKNEGCDLIYDERFTIDGKRNIMVNKCFEEQDNEHINSLVVDNMINEAETVIDDAKDSLTKISDRNMLISKIADSVYYTITDKTHFIEFLKDFYDFIVLKNKLNV